MTWATVLNGSFTSLYAEPSRIYTVGGGLPQTVFLAKLDPILSQVIYATYLWAGSVGSIAVDSAGSVYLAGAQSGGDNGIVTKVSADDSATIYSTVLNGAMPHAVSVDAAGNAVVAGGATSLTTTKGAYQSTAPGPCIRPPDSALLGGICCTVPSEPTHGFLAKLNGSGTLTYASYLSGSCGDSALSLALDSSGAAYLAGETWSLDFPVTLDAMAAKFPATYDSGFLAKLSPAGDQLIYSTFVGGGDFTAADALLLDGAGNVYLAGATQAQPTAGAVKSSQGQGCWMPTGGIGPSQRPPPTTGETPFVMKMTLSAAPPAFLATLGGSCQGAADSIALDTAGDIWLGGSNQSPDFATAAPISGLLGRPSLNSAPLANGFIAELNPTASALLSATVSDGFGAVTANSAAVYFAGGQEKVDASGTLTGNSAALVAEIQPAQAAPISIDEIVQNNPLGLSPWAGASPVAPGEIVKILGRGVGPQKGVDAKLTAAGTLSTSIGGVEVTFNGVAAPLVTVQSDQVVCIVPFEVNGLTSAAVLVSAVQRPHVEYVRSAGCCAKSGYFGGGEFGLDRELPNESRERLACEHFPDRSGSDQPARRRRRH